MVIKYLLASAIFDNEEFSFIYDLEELFDFVHDVKFGAQECLSESNVFSFLKGSLLAWNLIISHGSFPEVDKLILSFVERSDIGVSRVCQDDDGISWFAFTVDGSSTTFWSVGVLSDDRQVESSKNHKIEAIFFGDGNCDDVVGSIEISLSDFQVDLTLDKSPR